MVSVGRLTGWTLDGMRELSFRSERGSGLTPTVELMKVTRDRLYVGL